MAEIVLRCPSEAGDSLWKDLIMSPDPPEPPITTEKCRQEGKEKKIDEEEVMTGEKEAKTDENVRKTEERSEEKLDRQVEVKKNGGRLKEKLEREEKKNDVKSKRAEVKKDNVEKIKRNQRFEGEENKENKLKNVEKKGWYRDEEDFYRCAVKDCKAQFHRFARNFTLKRHWDTQHVKDSTQYHCSKQMCPVTCGTVWDMRQHLRSRHGMSQAKSNAEWFMKTIEPNKDYCSPQGLACPTPQQRGRKGMKRSAPTSSPAGNIRKKLKSKVVVPAPEPSATAPETLATAPETLATAPETSATVPKSTATRPQPLNDAGELRPSPSLSQELDSPGGETPVAIVHMGLDCDSDEEEGAETQVLPLAPRNIPLTKCASFEPTPDSLRKLQENCKILREKRREYEGKEREAQDLLWRAEADRWKERYSRVAAALENERKKRREGEEALSKARDQLIEMSAELEELKDKAKKKPTVDKFKQIMKMMMESLGED